MLQVSPLQMYMFNRDDCKKLSFFLGKLKDLIIDSDCLQNLWIARPICLFKNFKYLLILFFSFLRITVWGVLSWVIIMSLFVSLKLWISGTEILCGLMPHKKGTKKLKWRGEKGATIDQGRPKGLCTRGGFLLVRQILVEVNFKG